MRKHYAQGTMVVKKVVKQLPKNSKKSKFGMLSVKAGIDKNPNPTQADRIAGAKMSQRKKAMGGGMMRRTFKKGGSGKDTHVTKDGRTVKKANPGSKLKTAVTGKVKPGSKAANRRKSYCARSLGQLKRSSAKTRNDPNSRIRQARRRWKC
jgi:hypothetical protein